ncbi:hypothetical protein BD626DRAFT_484738 [Schizophyllum amplum]|uniref:Uncharacterized protein n=1 Tax=Schizophyllum amplum TaxID=97359 RepID=A0A550CQM8_9AGAR|nr:hypothetical protein BD626DRAFT_484738 [Auriculariopsis ampla]
MNASQDQDMAGPSNANDNPAMMSALEQYGAYDFAKDDVYLQGLASIIAGGALREAPDDVREEILRRTRVFYFNKVTERDIDIDDVRSYELAHGLNVPAGVGPRASLTRDSMVEDTASTTALSKTSMASIDNGSPEATTNGLGHTDAPRTLTFAELQALIEAGRVDEIPNNRDIPDKLNDAAPSESAAPPRKKPWETFEAA